MVNIESYSVCNCGAVTLYYDNGATNSCMRKNLKKFGISLRGVKKEKVQTWCCNHCANHYGIDICSCGSGKSYEKCCGTPMEEVGVEYDGFAQIVKNFAR